MCRSVCAESFSSARAATLRTTRSTARADSRRPWGPVNSARSPSARGSLPEPVGECLPAGRVQRHLAVKVALPGLDDEQALAGGDRHVVDVERDELVQPERGVEQQRHDRAVPRPGVLGGAYQLALLVDRQRPRRGLGERLTLDVRRAEAEEAIEVVDGGERQVDRRGLPAAVDLQMPLEVPSGVVPRLRVGERLRAVPAARQPGTVGGDVLAVGVLRSRCERRTLELAQAPLDGGRDRSTAALLVSRSRFRSL